MRGSAFADGQTSAKTAAIATKSWICGRTRPDIICYLLAAVHGVRQALQRGVERLVLLGKTEPHHRRHRIRLIKGRHRDRRDLVVGHDAPAERLVGLIETEWRQIDGEKIGALRPKNGKSDALQPRGETVTAARQFLAHLI